MLRNYNAITFNKCVKLGLGPTPKDIQNQQYTVTLIRGRINHNGYRAYQNMLPNTINDLAALVKKGKIAEEKVVKYADKLKSSWAPISVELDEYAYHFIYYICTF